LDYIKTELESEARRDDETFFSLLRIFDVPLLCRRLPTDAPPQHHSSTMLMDDIAHLSADEKRWSIEVLNILRQHCIVF
jgi:hypothetical protein